MFLMVMMFTLFHILSVDYSTSVADMFVLVPNLCLPQQQPPQQPPEYRAIQISSDGLGIQGKSGEWQKEDKEEVKDMLNERRH